MPRPYGEGGPPFRPMLPDNFMLPDMSSTSEPDVEEAAVDMDTMSPDSTGGMRSLRNFMARPDLS